MSLNRRRDAVDPDQQHAWSWVSAARRRPYPSNPCEVTMALVLVTGASAGLGLATASTLAGAGHDVVLHARNAGRLQDPGVRARLREILYADLGHLDETIRLADQ